MALIQWNPALSVNIAQIDNQHMKLVDIVNNLHDRMKEGKGKTILSGVLSELADYTVYHFKTEEELFKQHSYPKSDAHILEHNTLVQQVLKLKTDLDGGKTVITNDVMLFLRDWLSNHISGSDKAYMPFFNSKGVK
jgi:hemerythrin-like metal-binding protein